jgi:hypothetical protein
MQFVETSSVILPRSCVSGHGGAFCMLPPQQAFHAHQSNIPRMSYELRSASREVERDITFSDPVLPRILLPTVLMANELTRKATDAMHDDVNSCRIITQSTPAQNNGQGHTWLTQASNNSPSAGFQNTCEPTLSISLPDTHNPVSNCPHSSIALRSILRAL